MASLTAVCNNKIITLPFRNKKKTNHAITLNYFKQIPDIFLFVFFCHWDAFAIGFQFMLNNFPICIVFYTERMV